MKVRQRTNPTIATLTLLGVVLVLAIAIQSLAPSERMANSSEAGFVSYSPSGEAGGAIIPASCESGYTEHPWNEYCGPAATCSAPVQVYQVAKGCYDASIYYPSSMADYESYGVNAIFYTPPSQPLTLSATCQTLPTPSIRFFGDPGFGLNCDGTANYSGGVRTCSNTPVANPVCQLPAPTLYFNPPSVPYGAGSTVVWSWPETGGTRYCDIFTYGSEWNGSATGQDISGTYNPGGMNASGRATATCYKYELSTSAWRASPQANATLIVGSPPTGNARCASGTSWNGSVCAPDTAPVVEAPGALPDLTAGDTTAFPASGITSQAETFTAYVCNIGGNQTICPTGTILKP